MSADNTGSPAAPTQNTATPPFSYFEWMVARRYLGATRDGKGVSLISQIAFGGIMLAVAVLIIVMSVMQGFRLTLLDQLLGTNGHAFVQSSEAITDYDALVERLEAVPSVKKATPMIEMPVFASAHGDTGMIMRAVTPQDLQAIPYIADPARIIAGSLDGFGEGEKGGRDILIGSRLASTLGVGIGDGVTLLTARGSETAFGRVPRRKTFRVGAIFHVGNAEVDTVYGYMPLQQAQLFFNYPGSVQQIEVKVEDPQQIKEVRDDILQAAQGYDLYDWQQRFQSYFNALQTERFIMRMILFLIIMVATLNIITGLVMLVKDKTADIAVMRTMGATQGAIMRIFFLSGSMIGVFGTLAGVVLGALFVINIDAIENFLSMVFRTDLFPAEVYFLDGVPAKMELAEVALIAGFSLLMSFLTTVFPARRAARLDPVEALRYE